VQGPDNGVQVTHAYDAPGSYAITVTATDKDSAASPAAGQSVTVVPAELQGPDLVVGGTSGDDQITVRPADPTSGQVAVTLNGQSLGTFAVAGQILLYGGAGNDTITLQGFPTDTGDVTLSQQAMLFGGAGDDTLDATGSAAPDVLVGGAGNNLLLGGAGRNLMIGQGAGSELHAGASDSILIGGTTDYDLNPVALDGLMKEWSRDLDVATRIDHLTNGGGLNGAYRLNPTTVHANGSYSLYSSVGSSAVDWLFFHTLSDVKQSEPDDVLTTI
jgi:Ca2+-binding RTX toxin-like protein